jgi:type II secretory pathway component PulC
MPEMKKFVKSLSKKIFVLLAIGAGIHSGHSFSQETRPAAATAAFPLSLTGTVIGADGKNKAVVMDETDKKQYLLKVGDTVRGITVQQVERGMVVLVKDGKKETLSLKNRKGEGEASAPAEVSGAMETMLPPPPPPPPAPAPTPVP